MTAGRKTDDNTRACAEGLPNAQKGDLPHAQKENLPRAAGAYLTVFLALCLPILLSVFLTTIDGARRNAVRMQAELITDTAVNAVMSEFHRQLQEQYDLLFIDPSYGTGGGSPADTAERLRMYMEKNTEGRGLNLFGKRRDLLGLSVAGASVGAVRGAADDGGAALRQQVYAYMAAEPLGAAAADFLAKYDVFEGIGPDVTEWERRREENERELHEMLEEARDRAEEEAEELRAQGIDAEPEEVEDPTEEAAGFRLRPALLQVLGTTDGVSQARVDTGTLLSHRQLFRGSSPVPDTSHGYPEADAILLDEYILEKCGTWRGNEKKNHLKYQAEYILFGEGSDEANLEKTAGRLLLIRNAFNCAYIFADSGKTAQADAVAAGLSFILLMPEIRPVLRAALLFAWAYMESVYDVRSLFDGGRVPLLKTADTWKTSLLSILGLSFPGRGGKGSGLRYEDYLRLLLYAENRATKCYRLMDVMESDIRDTNGNESFRMDRCFDTVSVETRVTSGYGYEYTVRRCVTYN